MWTTSLSGMLQSVGRIIMYSQFLLRFLIKMNLKGMPYLVLLRIQNLGFCWVTDICRHCKVFQIIHHPFIRILLLIVLQHTNDINACP